MKSTLCAAVILGIAALGFTTQASAQNLVSNGDFSTGDFTNWTAGGDNFSTVSPGIAGSPNIAELGTTGAGLLTLSQTVTTTPGALYDISFTLSDPAPSVTNDDFFQVSFDGNTLLSLNNPSSFGDTQYNFYSFAATTAATDIVFYVQQKTDFFYLQKVSVTATVPEPSTWAGLAAALGSLTFLRRNRRASAV